MGLAAAVVPAYRRDLAAAHRRLAGPPVPVHRLPLTRRDVEYARYGSGPAVLVLHGAPGGSDQGVDWARRRLVAGRDVVAVSRFGYLGSALPVGATTAMQADVYAALLDALAIDPADVVALSAGSVTGLRFAVRHPDRVRRLVLESPMLPTRRPVRLPPAGVYRFFAAAQPLWWALPRLPFEGRRGVRAPAAGRPARRGRDRRSPADRQRRAPSWRDRRVPPRHGSRLRSRPAPISRRRGRGR